LDHLPGDRWQFDESVTVVFEDMLRRSIPQYDTMRCAVFDLGRRFVRPGTQIVDLGCSNGEALKPFVVAFGDGNRYLGVEVSPPMLAAARTSFAAAIDAQLMSFLDMDLRHDYPRVESSVTLCVLTLQFIPIEYRQQLLRQVYCHTVPGGALILVEKVLGAGAELSHVMVELYHQLKSHNGYSDIAIERKRMALEGVLVPVTARWNEDLLRTAGFEHVDCFWRWMNFCGWIAVRSR